MEDGLDMMYMFLPHEGEDQDVVHVDEHVLVKHISYLIPNEHLEDGALVRPKDMTRYS